MLRTFIFQRTVWHWKTVCVIIRSPPAACWYWFPCRWLGPSHWDLLRCTKERENLFNCEVDRTATTRTHHLGKVLLNLICSSSSFWSWSSFLRTCWNSRECWMPLCFSCIISERSPSSSTSWRLCSSSRSSRNVCTSARYACKVDDVHFADVAIEPDIVSHHV